MYHPIVEQDLRRMGVGRQYKGSFCVAFATGMYIENNGDHLYITKDVYPVVAKRMHLKWKAVEQNITYVARKCWEKNPEYLREIAGYELERQPSNQEFIDILVNHVLRAGEG